MARDAAGDLHAVAYISHSRLTGATRGDLAEQLERLVRRASALNAEAGLTGALICSPTHFGQVIEGPADALEETFERIQMDPRHAEVRVLYAMPIGARSFGRWGMASAGVVEADCPIADTLARLGDAAQAGDADAAGRQAMADLTRLLRDRDLA